MRSPAQPLAPRPAFAVVVAAFLVTMIGTTLPTPMYVEYQARFDFSLTMVTVIFATYAVGVLAALLVTGRWSDAIGRRPMLLAGLALSAASDVVFLAADATWVLLVGRLVSGVSAGIYVGTATAAVFESAPTAWRRRAPLVATAANIGGLGLGPLVAASLITIGPWPVHLGFAVHLAVALLVGALLLRIPETVDVEPGARLRVARPEVPQQARTTFVGAAVVGFAGFAVLGLMTAVSPRFVAEAEPGAGAILGVSVVTVLFLSSVLAQVLLSRVPLTTAVDLGCVLLAAGTGLLALAIGIGTLPLMLVAAVVGGAGQGLSFSKGLGSVLARVEPRQRAGTTSAFFVVAYVALSLPVVGDGLASQRFGLVPAGVAFSLVVTGLALAALLVLRLDRRAGTQPPSAVRNIRSLAWSDGPDHRGRPRAHHQAARRHRARHRAADHPGCRCRQQAVRSRDHPQE
ncbi:MFS transporter [Nocardioides sp.]|uniref:MFS transporter n=1 Tax=Nocardioides sp. TaxID=35761 RepID=UPI002615FEFE|nr:MFS transporter [Nocardioides sp.]